MNSKDDLLKQIAGLVKSNLDVPDTDLTISGFLHKLFSESGDQNSSNTVSYAQYRSTVNDNGGDDFPDSFIRPVYELLSLNAAVKEKDTSMASQSDLADRTTKPELLKNTPLSQSNGANTNNSIDLQPDNRTVTFERKIAGTNARLNESFRETRTEPRRNEAIVNHTREPELKVGAVYKGHVSNIAPYGAFIRLNTPSSISGLCHISAMLFDGRTRIRHPSDVVDIKKEVYVKVSKITGSGNSQKISLSMVGIDQITGVDQLDQVAAQHKRDREERGRPSVRENSKKRRLTSPERWEIQQLIASGAASAADYPELNATIEDDPATSGHADELIDVEVDIKEPSFLKGKLAGAMSVNPMAILKNPEGSLSRAAMTGSKLAQQIKEDKIKLEKQQEKDERARVNKSDALDNVLKLDQKQRDATEDVIAQWRRKQKSNPKVAKIPKLSIAQQRKKLPIYSMREELVSAVKDNQFLVIVGETGSGKTTQIVQYMYEEGLTNCESGEKIIGCTQPRRVAAVSVAARVAEEMGCKVGQKVGYTIRFEDKTTEDTRLKYMTDGILQREALMDPAMSKYSLIMLDEAHERTIATDVLFTLLKDAAAKNPNLKVIVTSATLDSEKFSTFFNSCPVIKIPGRTFPVKIEFCREPEPDYLAAALDCVMQIHVAEPEGDILVFLTGQEEIETGYDALSSRMKKLGSAVPELLVVPVYAALPSELQAKVFEPAPEGMRKVILATNIAETSITIDGVKYVIDPGFVKVNAYDPKLGMDSLVVSPISQAQANQRSGRAGRTGPGKCFRLYTEAAFKTEMLPNSIPEIQRKNLSATILMLKAMGINDLMKFGFMDPPPPQTMANALHELYTLDALDDYGFLTGLGRKMADFPMEPALAKTVLASVEHGCSSEILTIVAMLSVQTVFYRPKEKQAAADQRKQRFHSIHGDHITFLNVYRAWELSGRSSRWCKDNFIYERSMKRAYDVRGQLMTIMARFKLSVLSNDDNTTIRKAFCAGFFRNLARRDPQDGVYNTLFDQTPVHLHPSLALFGKSVEYVIYHTLLLTTKEYMHCATAIDPRWLPELAPKFFRQSDPSYMTDRKKREKIVPLFNKYAENQDSWRLSAQVEAKKKALELLHQ